MGLPIVDALLHPEKYDKRTEAEKALEGMNGTPLEQVANLTADPETTKNALHALFGVRDEDMKEAGLGATEFSLPTKKTPRGTLVGFDVTDEQRAGLEEYWDLLRTGELYKAGKAEDQLQELFSNETDMLDKLMDMIDILQNDHVLRDELDLPANWWLHGNDTGEGITNENLTAFNNLPSKMEKAVAKAVSGIRVSIDGRTAGQILAPYVSESIASNIS